MLTHAQEGRHAKVPAEFLAAREIKLLVVACNTASALALPAIRASLEIDVVGVIGPGARAAVASARKQAGGLRTVGVIATSTNTTGLCGNTFTATRTWQATDGCSNSITCSQIVSVVDATPPILICPADKGVLCNTNWSFDVPTATDLASGTNVTITLLSTVTNGVCGANGFSAVRTWQAIDRCGNIATCSQTIFNAQVLIAGTVSYPTIYPGASPSGTRVGAVTMSLAGTTTASAQTANDGTYSFSATAPATVTVSPILTNSNPVANGVTTVASTCCSRTPSFSAISSTTVSVAKAALVAPGARYADVAGLLTTTS
jgi:hypothetical protein